MASFRQLVVNFSHFFGGFAVSLVLGLLTFPILTRLLTHEEYGILGLVSSTLAIMVAFAKGGLSDGIIRFYREYANDATRLRVFTSTIVARGLLFAGVVTALYAVLIPSFNTYLGIDPRFTAPFLIMSVYLLVRPLNAIVMNYLRAVGKTLMFNVTNVVGRVSSIVLSIGLLLYAAHGLSGYFFGTVLAELLVTAILFRWFFANYEFAFRDVSKSLAWSLVRFGAPLLMTEFSYLLLQYTDRFLIVAFRGEATLGFYTVGYSLASYINDLVMFPLAYAIVPLYTELYTKSGVEPTRAFLNRALNYYIMGVIPLCVGYAAVCHDTIVVLASDKYAASSTFSPIILIGLVFLGVNSILNAGLYLTKRSMHILAVMLCAAAVSIGTNLWLLPSWGATGAALAMLAAGITSALLTVLLSFRHIALRVDISTLIYYLVLSGIMYGILALIHFDPAWLRLIVKLLLGAAIIGAGALYREAELRDHLRQFIAKLGRSADAGS